MRHGKKVAAIFLGLLLCAATLEGALFVLAKLRARDLGVPTGGAFVVLSLGNSITKGDGVAPGADYPAALEKILRQRHASLGPRVVNAARSNANSAILLEGLPALLATHRPQVVTLMTGDPNFWNRYGFQRFVEKNGAGSARERLRAFFEKLGSKSRALSWLSLIFVRQPQSHRYSDPASVMQWLAFFSDNSVMNRWLDQARLREIEDSLAGHLAKHPRDVHALQVLMRLAIRREDFERAHRWQGEIEKIDPTFFSFLPYSNLSRKLQDKSPWRGREGAEQLLQRLARSHPGERAYAFLEASQAREDLDTATYRIFATRSEPCAGPELGFRLYPHSYRRVRHAALCHLRHHRMGAALRSAESAIEANTYNTANHFALLRQIQPAIRHEAMLAKIDALKERLRASVAEKSPFHVDFFDQHVLDWVRSDIQEIRALVEKAGARLVLETYPPRQDQRTRAVDAFLREFARRRSLPLADHQQAMQHWFSDAGAVSSFFTQAFGPRDHHLSEKGHAEVAENLYQTLLANGLLPRK